MYIKAVTALRDYNSAIYSASVALLPLSICIVDAHIIGQLSYMIMYPVWDLVVKGSSVDLSGPIHQGMRHLSSFVVMIYRVLM
jgi:hypothetical protein